MEIKPSKYVSWQKYEEEIYVMDERTETICVLKEAGYTFWNIMIDCRKLENIVKKMAHLYCCSSEDLKEMLCNYIDELKEQEIIEVNYD